MLAASEDASDEDDGILNQHQVEKSRPTKKKNQSEMQKKHHLRPPEDPSDCLRKKPTHCRREPPSRKRPKTRGNGVEAAIDHTNSSEKTIS
nr:hypothetical protein Iba_chr08aCG9890 [Ipomoea batatas]